MLQATALTRPPDEIRAEVARATAARRQAVANAADYRARGDVPGLAGTTMQAARIEAHLAAYAWLLGDVDVAPVTRRRVPPVTARDLFLEQAPGPRPRRAEHAPLRRSRAAVPRGRVRRHRVGARRIRRPTVG